jgi:4-hydroxyphenylacetate 3-monooxygenase
MLTLYYDAAVSSVSGRQQFYERYYSGDPVRLAGALYSMYPKDAPVARIHQMLEELEARLESVARVERSATPRDLISQ